MLTHVIRPVNFVNFENFLCKVRTFEILLPLAKVRKLLVCLLVCLEPARWNPATRVSIVKGFIAGILRFFKTKKSQMIALISYYDRVSQTKPLGGMPNTNTHSKFVIFL